MTLTPVYQALKQCEGIGTHECHRFREHIFSAHEFLCLELASRYAYTAKHKGHVPANNELRHYHKQLTLGRHFQGLFIDSPDEDIKRFAEQKSLEIMAIFHGTSKRFKPGFALKRVIKKLSDCDIAFPLDDPSSATKEQVAAAIARCCDSDWWRRQIRKRQDVVLEHVHIALGKVNHRQGVYISNNGLQRKWAQWQRNEQILAGLEAENDLGQVFSLLDIAQRGVSNLVNRRHELMTRMRGFEDIAKGQGDEAVFYTITAPSKYHAYLSAPCKPNPQYGNFTPKDTQNYFNAVWACIRAKLKRTGIEPYGFRVVEPHHDSTPHWHLLLFVTPEHKAELTDIMREYALREDGHELGAQKHRFKAENIDPNKGSATGYIAKYVAKNIDGQNVGDDHYGFDAVDSAVRIRAWASNWSIRQFQQIGGPSVTAWREVRRLASQQFKDEIIGKIDSELLSQLIDAADTGDWAAFTALSGGPTAYRKDQPLRAFHIPKQEKNKYGEITKKLLGLLFRNYERIVTRVRQWVVRSKDITHSLDDLAYRLSTGGANAPPLEFCK